MSAQISASAGRACSDWERQAPEYFTLGYFTLRKTCRGDERMKTVFDYEVGDFVIHPSCPDWGIGQVQSVIGERVTVSFEHAGKQLINASLISLTPVAEKTD